MHQDLNPYDPAAVDGRSLSNVVGHQSTIGRASRIGIGVLLSGLLAGLIAFPLTYASLLPPLNGLLGMASEFAGMLLIGTPLLAAICGALAGTAFALENSTRNPLRVSWGLALVIVFTASCFGFRRHSLSGLPYIPMDVVTTAATVLFATLVSTFLCQRLLTLLEERFLQIRPGNPNQSSRPLIWIVLTSVLVFFAILLAIVTLLAWIVLGYSNALALSLGESVSGVFAP